MKQSNNIIFIIFFCFFFITCSAPEHNVKDTYDAFRTESLLLNSPKSILNYKIVSEDLKLYENEKNKYLRSRSIESLKEFKTIIPSINVSKDEMFWIEKDIRRFTRDHYIEDNVPHQLKLPLFQELKSCNEESLIKYFDALEFYIKKLYDQGQEDKYISLQKALLYTLKSRKFDKKYPRYYNTMLLNGGLFLVSSTKSHNSNYIKFIVDEVERKIFSDQHVFLAKYDYLKAIESNVDYRAEFNNLRENYFHTSSWIEVVYSSLIYFEISLINEDINFAEEILKIALEFVPSNCEEPYRLIQRMIAICNSMKENNDFAMLKMESIINDGCEKKDKISHLINIKYFADFLKKGCVSGNNKQCREAIKYYDLYLNSFDSLITSQDDGHYTDIIIGALLSKINLSVSAKKKIEIESIWKDIQLTKYQRGIIKNRIKNKLPEIWKKLNTSYNLANLQLNKLSVEKQLTSKLNEKIYDDLVQISNLPSSVNRKRGSRNITIKDIKDYNKTHDNLFLEFLCLSDSTYLRFVISDDESQAKFIYIPKKIREFISKYKYAISKKSEDIYSDEFVSNNKALSSLLFEDIKLKNYKSLSFIGDGNLFNLPLEYLLIETQSEWKYLLDSFLISYLHHSSHLLEELHEKIHTFSFIGFTDESTKKSKEIRRVPELDGIIKELEVIEQIIPSKNLISYSGQDATIQNLTRASQADLMHISTHAYSNTSLQTDNYIILRNKNDIEYFYGFEFQNFNQLSDIVIFSACETGIGQIEKGEGINSFSKYLFENNVKTVISTKWKINDNSTHLFFKIFYENLFLGNTILSSLTNAKRALKQNPKYAHPYYWAGFVLEGNPNIRLDIQ